MKQGKIPTDGRKEKIKMVGHALHVRKYFRTTVVHYTYVYTYVQSYAYEYLILQMFAYVASFRERSHLGRAPAAATNDEAAR